MRHILASLAAFLFAFTAADSKTIPVVLVGIHANQDDTCDNGLDVADCAAELAAVESALGRQVGLDSQYLHWDELLTDGSLTFAQNDIDAGRVPMLTWFWGNGGGDCKKAADIAAGVYDADLIAAAAKFKALTGNILVRSNPAMDQPSRQCYYDYNIITDPYDCGQQFIAAWDHIHDLFISQGVTNVRWDWSPADRAFTNANDTPDTNWQNYWPGASYADYIGVELYNANPAALVSIQNDPAFLNFYNQASTLGLPLMFSETGADGPNPQMDANGIGCTYSITVSPSPAERWLFSMATHLQDFPAIQAMVYFDSVGAGGPLNCSNYTLRGASMTSFAGMLGRKYFQKRDLP